MNILTYFSAMNLAREDMERYTLRRRNGRQGIAIDQDWFARLWQKRDRQYNKFYYKVYSYIETL